MVELSHCSDHETINLRVIRITMSYFKSAYHKFPYPSVKAAAHWRHTTLIAITQLRLTPAIEASLAMDVNATRLSRTLVMNNPHALAPDINNVLQFLSAPRKHHHQLMSPDSQPRRYQPRPSASTSSAVQLYTALPPLSADMSPPGTPAEWLFAGHPAVMTRGVPT